MKQQTNIEELSFYVTGMTASDDEAAHIVAIMLEPEPGATSVKAIALHNWDQVAAVVAAILSSATVYWGEPPPGLRALPVTSRTEH